MSELSLRKMIEAQLFAADRQERARHPSVWPKEAPAEIPVKNQDATWASVGVEHIAVKQIDQNAAKEAARNKLVFAIYTDAIAAGSLLAGMRAQRKLSFKSQPDSTLWPVRVVQGQPFSINIAYPGHPESHSRESEPAAPPKWITVPGNTVHYGINATGRIFKRVVNPHPKVPNSGHDLAHEYDLIPETLAFQTAQAINAGTITAEAHPLVEAWREDFAAAVVKHTSAEYLRKNLQLF